MPPMSTWDRIDGRGRGPGAPAGGRPADPGTDPGADGGSSERRPPDWPFVSAARARPWPRPRTVAGVLLLVVAVGLLALGVLLARDGGRPDPAAQPLARFSLPAGWTDRTAELAARVPGVRPELVLQGPVHEGFAGDLNVVRERRGPQDPPLDRLVALVSAQVATRLRASLVGARTRLLVDGAPAVAYDYRYRARGHRLRARQVTIVHGGSVVFLNFTAADRAFARDVRALDQMVASWHWG
jgi:hypothetical protein